MFAAKRLPGPKFDVHAKVADWNEDDRMEWEERSAIREYDGGMTRDKAELSAYFDIIKIRNKGHVPSVS